MVRVGPPPPNRWRPRRLAEREVGEVEPALQLDQQAGRRLAADAGHGAQRLEVVLEHRGRQGGRREHRHDGQRQRRADAVRAEQHLEAAALVVVDEAVEDDGVLADVRVHEQGRVGTASRPSTSAAAVAGVTVTR